MDDFDPDAWLETAGAIDEEPEWVPTVSTVFGHNLDGSRDREDNGMGAWGDSTGEAGIPAASLPRPILKKLFGNENKARGAVLEVLNPANGGRIQVPVLDKGPATWTGAGLDLTGTAAGALGLKGRDLVMYRLLGERPPTKNPPKAKVVKPAFDPDAWLQTQDAPKQEARPFDPDSWIDFQEEGKPKVEVGPNGVDIVAGREFPYEDKPPQEVFELQSAMDARRPPAEIPAKDSGFLASLKGQLAKGGLNTAAGVTEAVGIDARAGDKPLVGKPSNPEDQSEYDQMLEQLAELQDYDARTMEGPTWQPNPQIAVIRQRLADLEGKPMQERLPAQLRGAAESAFEFYGADPRSKNPTAQVGRGVGSVATLLPTMLGTGGAGLPMAAVTGASQAYSEAYSAKEAELRAAGVADELAIAEGARDAGIAAAVHTTKTLPIYLLAGKAAASATGKLLGEAVSPVLRTAAQTTTATAANVGVGATMRALEGQDPTPTLEQLTVDALWGIVHGVGEYSQASRMAKSRAMTELDKRAAEFAREVDDMTAAVPERTPAPENRTAEVPRSPEAAPASVLIPRPEPEISTTAEQLPTRTESVVERRPDDLPGEPIDPEVAALSAENVRLAELENARVAAVPDDGGPVLTRTPETASVPAREAYSPTTDAELGGAARTDREAGREVGGDRQATGRVNEPDQGPRGSLEAESSPLAVPRENQRTGGGTFRSADRLVEREASYLPDDAGQRDVPLRSAQTPSPGERPVEPQGTDAAGVPTPKRSRRLSSKLPQTAKSGWDIIDEIEGSFGKIRGTSGFRRRGEKVPPEYDGAGDIPKFFRSHIFAREGGATPDEVAQGLYDAGFLKEPSVDLLWQEIAGAAKGRSSGVADRKAIELEEKQAERFDRDALEPAREGNAEPEEVITVDELNKGDRLQVGKEQFVVKLVDEDGYVVMEDGKTYGLQRVDPGTVMFAEVKERAAGDSPGDVPFSRRESEKIPGDLWYQGVGPDGGATSWVTSNLEKARIYATRRGPGGKINVFTPDQVGRTAFEDRDGNLISPQEYARTQSEDTTIQTLATEGKLPTPKEVLPATVGKKSVGDSPTDARDPETYWQRVYQRIAPGASERLALKLGDPGELAKAGLLDPKNLTGTETAAWVAREQAIYLLDRAVGAEMRPETMLDVLHESAHAWFDSIKPEVRSSLEKLWRAEVENRTGPLFDSAGELRPGVNRDAVDSVQEWFAERAAHENLAWASKRAAATDHDGSILGRTAAAMRAGVLRVREALGERPDAITARMRNFLHKGAELDGAATDVAFSARGALPGAAQQEPPVAISGRLPRISRIWLGGADVIGKIKGMEGLARAIRKHVDAARMLQGRLTAPFRAWDKKYSRGERKKALQEFEDYQKQRDAERDPDFFNNAADYRSLSRMPVGSRELRNRASEAGKALIDLWATTADRVQRRNQALNVMVKGEQGWRPIGTVTDYFPRSLRPEIMRMLRNPERNAKKVEELARDLQEAGLIGSPAEAEAFINQRLKTSSQFDYLGNIEAVRQIPLPTKAYDYSFNAGRRYLMSWAERVAQIEAYGQKTTKESKDLFDIAKERAGSRRSIAEYVEALRQRAYNEHPTHGWARGMQLLNSAVTGLMLGNPVTVGVNVMSGLGYTGANLGWMNSLKGFWELRHLGRTIDQAYEKGVLLDDLMRLAEDAEGSGSRAAEVASKATNVLLTASGYNASEVFVRAHAMATANAFLRQYLRAEPGGRQAKYFEDWFRRNSVDPAKLAGEKGAGLETDKFLRTAVNVGQGGYRFDQVPIFTDSPVGRFLFKYQKWGTQAARNFMENFVKPLRHPTDWRAWRDAMRYLVTTALIGAGIEDLKSRLFGVAKTTASLDEIAKTSTEDERRALELLAQRWWRNSIAAGAFGILGNYAQAATDVFDRSRYKNPLDPPGLAPLKSTGDLVLTLLEQGKLTKDNLSDFLRQQMSLYRTMKAASAKALQATMKTPPAWAGDEVNRQEVSWLNAVLRRYTSENDFAGRTTQIGRVGATKATPFKVEIREALLRGDAAAARKEVRAYVASVPANRRADALKSLQASVRATQPLRFEGTASEALRIGFVTWAKKRLSKEELERVMRLDRNYRSTSTAAGLVNFGKTKTPSLEDVQEALQRRAAR